MRALILPVLLSGIVLALPSAADRPNIVFMMSDDHAAHAIGAYGSRVNQTPHIDRLARDGVMLRSVFATNSICTPSRAAILTGQYSHINGVTMFNRFDSSRMTVARLLQQGGYYTGMIGKWHLGSDPVGFDHWEILPGQGAYMNPVLYTATGEHTYAGRYVTDVLTDLAIDFMKNRPRGKPFFLMLHHKAPHRPWEADASHRAQFADRWIPEPETFWDSYATRTDALHENMQRVAADLTRRDLKLQPPPDLQGAELAGWLATKPDTVTTTRGGTTVTLTGETLARWKYQRYMQDYLATVQSVDDSVGRVLDFLDRNGLAKNTIVIYTSDQGFFLGDHGLFDKRFMYEESLRMPFLVRWPAAVKAGTRSDAIALDVDFAPTFLDAAGLPVPGDMQGRSLLPVLRGRTPADWRTSMYYRYYHDPGDHNTRAHYGVRTRTHKLICFWKKNQWELFDLVNDPFELHNLYGEPGQEKLTATLKAELLRLKQAVRDDDQFANEQLPNGVDGPVARLRGGVLPAPTKPPAAPHTTWSDYGGGADALNNYLFNPVVVDGVMYVLAKNNSIVALDAATGKEIWAHANARSAPRSRGYRRSTSSTGNSTSSTVPPPRRLGFVFRPLVSPVRNRVDRRGERAPLFSSSHIPRAPASQGSRSDRRCLPLRAPGAGR